MFAQDQNLMSEQARNERCDSLLFSITSRTEQSDTGITLKSVDVDVSDELHVLQQKINSLEDKVQHISADQPIMSRPLFKAMKENQNVNALEKIQNDNSETRHDKNQNKQEPIHYIPGRIQRKNRTDQTSKCQCYPCDTSQSNNRIVDSQSYSRRYSQTRKNSEFHKSKSNGRKNMLEIQLRLRGKMKEVSRLKRQLIKTKYSAQKHQRSRNMCTERLSESKNRIKLLEKERKGYERIIQKLIKQLKRSENIRSKQKQLIIQQKEQIKKLKSQCLQHKQLR